MRYCRVSLIITLSNWRAYSHVENHHKSKTMRSPENTGSNTYNVIRQSTGVRSKRLTFLPGHRGRTGHSLVRDNSSFQFEKLIYQKVRREDLAARPGSFK